MRRPTTGRAGVTAGKRRACSGAVRSAGRTKRSSHSAAEAATSAQVTSAAPFGVDEGGLVTHDLGGLVEQEADRPAPFSLGRA